MKDAVATTGGELPEQGTRPVRETARRVAREIGDAGGPDARPCEGIASGASIDEDADHGGEAVRVDASGGSAAIVHGAEYAVAMRSRPLPRWLGPFYLIAGFGLLPWSVGLAITLPATTRTTHYGVAWFGFDLLLGALLIRTGWLAVRHRANIELTAAATATMLVIDAWFDTMTSSTHDQFVLALILAFCIELPLAGLCLYIAGSVELRRQRQQLASHRLVRQLVETLDRGRRAATTPHDHLQPRPED